LSSDDVHVDPSTLGHLPAHDGLGERILDVLLDRPPKLARSVLRIVALVHQDRLGGRREDQLDAFAVSCLLILSIIRRMICWMCASDSAWNTMMSSIRLMNSGRNARFISSITRSFIFS